MKETYKIVPIFIPHLGCRNSCSFCNQNAITNQSHFNWNEQMLITEERICVNQNSNVELAFFGGSFTAIEKSLRCKLLTYGRDKKREGKISRIRISTRPDELSVSQIQELIDYKVDFVEIGIQSFSEQVLKKNNRHYEKSAVEDAIKNLRKCGMPYGLQLLYGLDGETEQSFFQSVDEALSYHPRTLRLYPIMVLENTELAKRYEEGQYTPPSANSIIRVGAYVYSQCIKKEVSLIRVGLYPEECMQSQSVAGFFHPCFLTVMESYFFYKTLITEILENNYDTLIEINCPKRFIHGIAGYEAFNIKKIRELCKFKVKLIANDTEDCIVLKTKEEEQKFLIIELIESYQKKVIKCI